MTPTFCGRACRPCQANLTALRRELANAQATDGDGAPTTNTAHADYVAAQQEVAQLSRTTGVGERCNIPGAVNYAAVQFIADPAVNAANSVDCVFDGDGEYPATVLATRGARFAVETVGSSSFGQSAASATVSVSVMQGQSVLFSLGPGDSVVEVINATSCTAVAGGFGVENHSESARFQHRFVRQATHHFASADMERCARGMRGVVTVVPATTRSALLNANRLQSCSDFTAVGECLSAWARAISASSCNLTGSTIPLWASTSTADVLGTMSGPPDSADRARVDQLRCPGTCARAAIRVLEFCPGLSDCQPGSALGGRRKDAVVMCGSQRTEGIRRWAIRTRAGVVEAAILAAPPGTDGQRTELGALLGQHASLTRSGEDISATCAAAVAAEGRSNRAPGRCDGDDATSCCTDEELSQLCRLDVTTSVRAIAGFSRGGFRQACEPLFSVAEAAERSGTFQHCRRCAGHADAGAQAQCNSTCVDPTGNQQQQQRRRRRDDAGCRELTSAVTPKTELMASFFTSGDDCSASLPTAFNSHAAGDASYPPAWKWDETNPQCGYHHIHDQGSCGSCYTFSAAGMMADRLCLQSPGVVGPPWLAHQELLSCSAAYGNLECEGGWMDLTNEYILEQQLHQTQTESCGAYEPDTAWDGIACEDIVSVLAACEATNGDPYFNGEPDTCTWLPYPSQMFKVTAAGTGFELSASCTAGSPDCITGEELIMLELMTFGPVEATLTTYDTFKDYDGGVYNDLGAVQSYGGHAIKLIGWGTDNGDDYWLAENSWGGEWGEYGYFRIRRKTDNAGFDLSLISFDPFTGVNDSFVGRVYYAAEQRDNETFAPTEVPALAPTSPGAPPLTPPPVAGDVATTPLPECGNTQPCPDGCVWWQRRRRCMRPPDSIRRKRQTLPSCRLWATPSNSSSINNDNLGYKPPDDDDDMLLAIILGALGGVVVLGACIGAGVVVRRRRRQHQHEKAAVAVSDQRPDNIDGNASPIERVRGKGVATDVVTNDTLAGTVDPTAPSSI